MKLLKKLMSVLYRYLTLYNPQRVDTSGLLWCVGEALKLFGVDNVLNQDSALGV